MATRGCSNSLEDLSQAALAGTARTDSGCDALLMCSKPTGLQRPTVDHSTARYMAIRQWTKAKARVYSHPLPVRCPVRPVAYLSNRELLLWRLGAFSNLSAALKTHCVVSVPVFDATCCCSLGRAQYMPSSSRKSLERCQAAKLNAPAMMCCTERACWRFQK